MDVIITHPATQTMREKASKEVGAAAKEAEEAKRRDHAKEGTKGFTFVPFAIETYGRLGREAENLLKQWADSAASTAACEREAYLHWIKQEISLSLIRGNAKLLKRFVGMLTRGIGQLFE